MRQAQEALNNVTEQYDALLAPLNAELKGIHDRRQAIIDEQRTDVLQDIVNDENAPALAKELAMMELREIELRNQIAATEDQKDTAVDAAEANLDAAQTAEEAAQEQLAVQQALIDAQIEQNSLIQEQIDLLKRLAETDKGGGAGGGGKAIPNIGEALGLGGIAGGMGTALDSMTERLSQFAEDVKAPFAALKEKVDAFKLSWAEAGLALVTRLGEMKTAVGTWFNETFPSAVGNMKNVLAIFSLLWKKIVDDTIRDIKALGMALTESWGEGGVWEGNAENLKKIWTLLGEKFTEWKDDLEEKLTAVTTFITDQWGAGGTWDGVIENVKTILSGLIDSVLTPLKEGLTNLITPIQEFITWIGNLGTAVANLDLAGIWALLGHSPSPFESSLYRINDALHTVANSGFPTLQHSMNQTAVNLPVSQAQVGAASIANSRTENNFNMGGNSISNGMDMAMFEAAVLRVVEGALS